MAFPDTNLKDDAVDPQYGGNPANSWTQDDRSYVDAVLQFFGQFWVNYVRRPYVTFCPISQSDATAGEVLIHRTTSVLTNGGYYTRSVKGVTIGAGDLFAGVYLEACSAGDRVRVACGGIIPPAVTGLAASSTAPRPLTWDTVTGKLKVAGGGDIIIGYADMQGHVFLSFINGS